MLKVGITGGIGSGKTTICRLFETMGIAVYYADDAAKWLMNNDIGIREAIITHFGVMMYLPDGNLHRSALSAAVFEQPKKLRLLESIVHPAVLKHSQAWIDAQPDTAPYVLKEAAILFESGSFRQLDRIITVVAPIDLRIERVMQRDHSNEAAIRARIALQMPDEEKIKRSDFVIYNDGLQLLIPQVVAIHRALLAVLTTRIPPL